MGKPNPKVRAALREIVLSGRDRNSRTGEPLPPSIVRSLDSDTFTGIKPGTFRDNLEKVRALVAQ